MRCWILFLAGLLGSCAPDKARSLILIAIDGMDPRLSKELLLAGELPNLAKLQEAGAFIPLGTTTPPQSPVAWSDFITGHHSEEHGIYDFLHRDLETMGPYLSTSQVKEPWATLSLGALEIPLLGGQTENLREGAPFWDRLVEAGIPTTVVKIPAHYPPKSKGGRVLAGMGVPDLLGTPGTFQLFTNDPTWISRTVSAGIISELKPDGDNRFHADLVGPPSPLSKQPMRLSFAVEGDPNSPDTLHFQLGDSAVLLSRGEFSEWIPVTFSFGLGSVSGMVRVLLKSLEPLTLYVSPINMDPLSPAEAIGSPGDFAANLARKIGRFYTQGMAEDTKALSGGVLTDAEFLAQADLVFHERRRLLDESLDGFAGGFLYFYFSTLDLVSHMFWGYDDPLDPRSGVVKQYYRRLDAVVGEVMHKHPGALVVMSDHGFAKFHTKVHLNTWLYEKGYLALGGEGENKGRIDWSKTRAYALGLNQLYVNLEGRERQGVVRPEERSRLLSKIERKLKGFVDPDNGRRVVSRVFRPDATKRHTPDLIIGYNRGYRSSDDSALLTITQTTLEPNSGHWNGDHCMDPAEVPGVLFTNLKLLNGSGSLIDLAPSVAQFFRQPHVDLPGQVLFGGP